MIIYLKILCDPGAISSNSHGLLEENSKLNQVLSNTTQTYHYRYHGLLPSIVALSKIVGSLVSLLLIPFRYLEKQSD